MTDLRTAAQQALEALETNRYAVANQAPHLDVMEYNAAITALRAALSQQAEPVEPVAYIHRQGNHWEVSERFLLDDEKARGWTEEPLYTAPPQRKPLAEWQINDLMAGIDPEDVCSWSFRQGVYAAEKHHGVKP